MPDPCPGDALAAPRFFATTHWSVVTAVSVRHPNIVAIYEVGEQAGHPHFAMELIEGRNLSELARDHPLLARQAAQLAGTIAAAVQFAHERHVLRRDLKPSNIHVDTLEVPHVTDFGLAKRSDGEADLTLTGQVLGTPSYMSPEQADPERGQRTGQCAIPGRVASKVVRHALRFGVRRDNLLKETLRFVLTSP